MSCPRRNEGEEEQRIKEKSVEDSCRLSIAGKRIHSVPLTEQEKVLGKSSNLSLGRSTTQKGFQAGDEPRFEVHAEVKPEGLPA